MNTDESSSTDIPVTDDIIVEPLVHWATLADFKVEVLGHTKINAKCYKNTRQQVPIKVTLDARDENGVQVTLTTAQLQEITLRYYETDYPMGGWSHTKNEYEYNFVPSRDDGSELQPVDDEDLPGVKANTITLYIATSMAEKKLAAKIISSTGAVYSTKDFDSWINVLGVEVPIHPAAAFVLSNSGGPTGDRYDCDVYYLRFRTDYGTGNYSIKGSHHLDVGPGLKHYSWAKDGWREKAQFAYKVGPRTTVGYGQPGGGSFVINDKAGQANAARISNRSYQPINRDINARVVYYDQYGNPGMVQYNNSSNGNTMHISDAGDPPRDPEIYGE